MSEKTESSEPEPVQPPPFQPDNLRLVRHFHGWTLEELSERVRVTKQFVGYLEKGEKRPAEPLLYAIADVSGFKPGFFHTPLLDRFADEQCAFRKPQRTTLMVRQRLCAHGTLFARFVAELDELVQLPPDKLPTIRAPKDDDLERVAAACRKSLGLSPAAPIVNPTRWLENAGVVVAWIKGDAAEVDAFSRSTGSRKTIVVNTDKPFPSRWVWDVAHECAHLVMHQGQPTGTSEIEREADRFASCFLLPKAGFAREFPRQTHPLYLGWDALFRLKQRWRVSVIAIVRRAYDLKLISSAQYQQANKYYRMQGWQRGEPAEFRPDEPEVLPHAMGKLPEYAGITLHELAGRLQWAPWVLQKVTGLAMPGAAIVDINARKRAPKGDAPPGR